MRLKKREQFEVIVDTCAASTKALKGLSKLLKHIEETPAPVFAKYRITVPIQLGTESKQCLFPEFLEARLRQKTTGHLEEFYAKHREHFKIVETDTSWVYKITYAQHALDHLNALAEPERHVQRASILKVAHKLETEYNGKHPHQFNDAMLDAFLKDIAAVKEDFEFGFERIRNKTTKFHEDLNGKSDEALGSLLKAKERMYFAQFAKRFFNNAPEEYRYLLQAMYSDKAMNEAISKKPQFKSFRQDKGERAIEDFLFDKRSESNPDRVTVILSDDQGARRSIERLREKSHNTIFCVSTYGLAHALKYMNLVDDISRVISPAQLKGFQERQTRREQLREKNGTAHVKLTMSDVLDLPIERKWAGRLADVIKWGQWKEPQRHSQGFSR